MNDADIVRLFWERDEDALQRTDEKYGAYCHSIAVNITENTEDAKECVNDAYFKTWSSIPPNRPENLGAYLGKIVRNISFNRYKEKNTFKRGGGQTALVFDELEECISDNSLHDEVDRKELVKTLNSFLKTLSKKNRRIFVCRYWYADSISDIACEFDMTENNVSVTLNRLRKKMHKYLAERGFEL